MFIGRKWYGIISISKEIIEGANTVYTIKANDGEGDGGKGHTKTISFDSDDWEQIMEINKGTEQE